MYQEDDNLDMEAIEYYRSLPQEELERLMKEEEGRILKEIKESRNDRGSHACKKE